MRVLHLDSGTEMRGGQWQVLSLLKGLGAGNVLAYPGRRAVDGRGKDVPAFKLPDCQMLSLGAMARDFDLVHAHDARSHTWAARFGADSSTCRFAASRVLRWDRPSSHDGSTDEPAAISLFRSM